MTAATLEPPAPPAAGDEAGTPRPSPADWMRDNRLFTAALALATLLRLLVAIAYAPALEFFGDSPSYLAAARHPWHANIWHPLGYPVLLWLVSVTRNLLVLTTLQHLLGLATGVLLYRLVRSFGIGAIGGTVAAAVPLFDAYQLDVEQFVLSDTLFTFLVVAAISLTVRLVRNRTAGVAIALGAVLGAATLTRTIGLFVAAVVVVVALVARVGLSRVGALVAACAVPVGGYALAFHATYGVYGLQGFGGRYLYGIVAPFASCDRATLPAVERGLCPTLPRHARPGSNQYVWAEFAAAQLPGDGIEKSQIAGRFAQKVAREEPGRFAAAAAASVLHYFTPGRQTGPRDWFVGSWQFPLPHRSPAWNIQPASYGFRAHDQVHGQIIVGLADVLRGYQRVVYTPGPALLLAIVAAAAASCARRRDSRLRLAAALLGGSGVVLIVVPAFSAGFDWRYLLPAQAVLVAGGVVAAQVLRPQRRQVPRRVWAPAAGVVVVALFVTGLPGASVYAATTTTPPAVLPLPGEQSVGGHLTVDLGKPVLLDVRCWPWRTSQVRRLVGFVALPVTARQHGDSAARLVQPGNFAVTDGIVAFPGVQPNGRTLPSVVLDRRYPQIRGTLYAYVSKDAGTVDYVDPIGGGAASWRFHLPPPPGQQPIGSRCTGATPWGGAKLDVLHLAGIPPFTMLDQQPFTYGLRRQAWRAYSYDVRWRSASPTTAPGPWQYPATWQRTTARQQALFNLAPGMTYCFSVRARDALDAVTAWTDPRCTTRMYDDASLPPSPGWERSTGQQGFYFGTYTATRTQDAAIAVSGTFSQVSLSLYRCPDCGVLDVYVGPRLVRSLNLASSAANQGLLTWQSPVQQTTQQTTVTLRVRSQNRLVVLDALGLLR